MAFTTNLNIPPYYNDYDETKNYYQILFRPSTAVQARELTQLQNILQSQIQKFGQWAFKNGDIVQECTINDVPVVPYVFLADADATANGYDARTFVNCVAISPTNNLRARVVFANVGFQANYPNCNIIYLNYLNTGTDGSIIFSNSQLLQFYSVSNSGLTLVTNNANVYTLSNVAGTNTTGNAHGIIVGQGVVFLDGAFVTVQTPTFGLVNNFGTDAGNNVVGFQAIETIVTENQDSSLYDNALGYPNENAPGAHRLKITPTLLALDPNTAANTSNFNPVAIYNFNTIITKSSANQLYSTVSTAIAKRIYDEAGNYVVNPFYVDTVTNIAGNSLPTQTGNNVYGRINPGSGYAQGQFVEVLKTAYINMRRGVDTQVNKQQQITFNYGSYFICNEVAGSFPMDKAQTVKLYDTPQLAITNRTFSALTPVGNYIGTAQIRCFSYSSGTPGSNSALYLIHVFNIQLGYGYNSSNIKSLYFNGSPKGVADVYSAGLVGASAASQIYGFGVNGIQKLRDGSNNNNSEYVYRSHQTTSLYSNGVIVVTLPASATGGTDTLPYGVGTLAYADSATTQVICTANVDTTALSGTVSVSSTNTSVIGTSSTFISNFFPGDQIKVGSTIRTVTGIVNNTFLSVDSSFGVTAGGQTYYKSFLQGKIISIPNPLNSINGYINVTNSTSFTVVTGLTLQSANTVDVYYDVLRTGVSPAKKVINKDRFVCINAVANPLGPWCLGFSDIHKVTAVYGCNSTSYSTNGTNITSSFSFDTGQKDTHYDLGYLYSKGGYRVSDYPNLLVQLDYFTTNNSPGIGFFTVESYPIQDNPSLANSSTIYTKEVPLYVATDGSQKYLRDYVDFRIPSISTAVDTGKIDISNSAQVSTAILSSSVNPSNTLTLANSTSLNVPSYGRNFQADYTMYLPRKDLVYITADNIIKVKEGLSSTNPQTPLFPDNGMAVSVLNVPPFPSLSSDEVLQDQTLNQLSKNLVRDTTTAISGSLVTNRGYKMADIGKLDQRITNLEYYTSLSLLQQSATALTVTDANGLNRFKNGIFVEPFNDFSYSDVSNPEYSVAIDGAKGIARPKFAQETIPLKFSSGYSTNVVKTGRCVTLPYTEVSFLSQPFATKYRSSAHVSAAWNGSMILLPNFNDNIDLNQTASVNVTIDNTKPWQQFASSPFGSIWGPWQTTQATTVRSVVTGTATTLNVNLGYNMGGAIAGVAAQYAAAGWQIGSISSSFVGSHGGTGWGAETSSTTIAVSSDTSSTIVKPLGNVPNYQNIGSGYPTYQG